MKAIFSVVAGVLFFVGFVPYILYIRRKDTKAKPSKATWIIWASLDTITLAGMYAKDAVNGQSLGAVIGGWVVVAFALKYGTPGWTRLEKFCLGGAVLGIVLWQVSSNPLLGIITSLSVVFLGSIPTFVSAWKDPSSENKSAWTIFWISCVCAIMAIPQWTLADAGQPITFAVIESIMMYILYIRAHFLKKRNSKK